MSKNKREMASNYSEAPDAKKPCKGILKTSSSFDRPSLLNHRKSAKFDELNVLQTFHPADKDYGHMKIDEPKTPYRVPEGEEDSVDQLDAESLAEKLRNVPTTRSSFSDFDDDDDDDDGVEETEEERVKRKEFEKRRKAHYNEFEAVRRARLLMQNDDDDDDDEDENDDDAGPDGDTLDNRAGDHFGDAVDVDEDSNDSNNTAGPSTCHRMDVDGVDVAKPSSSAASSSALSSSRVADDV